MRAPVVSAPGRRAAAAALKTSRAASESLSMTRVRHALLPILILLSAALALPSSTLAAPADPNGFHFLSAVQSFDESAGKAVITVVRTDTARPAQVRYITIGLTAQAPY